MVETDPQARRRAPRGAAVPEPQAEPPVHPATRSAAGSGGCRTKLPHLKHFVCYNLRHTYATDALDNGVGIAQVAELLGHTEHRMVSKHYGHLSQKVAHMRDAAAKAATSG